MTNKKYEMFFHGEYSGSSDFSCGNGEPVRPADRDHRHRSPGMGHLGWFAFLHLLWFFDLWRLNVVFAQDCSGVSPSALSPPVPSGHFSLALNSSSALSPWLWLLSGLYQYQLLLAYINQLAFISYAPIFFQPDPSLIWRGTLLLGWQSPSSSMELNKRSANDYQLFPAFYHFVYLSFCHLFFSGDIFLKMHFTHQWDSLGNQQHPHLLF